MGVTIPLSKILAGTLDFIELSALATISTVYTGLKKDARPFGGPCIHKILDKFRKVSRRCR